MKTLLFPALLASAFLLSCSPPVVKCTTLTDCANNQVCVQGECRGGFTGGGTGSTGGGTGGVGGGVGGGAVGGGTGIGGGSGGTGGGASGTGGGGGSVLMEPDAGITPILDGGCGLPMPGNPTIRRLCATATDNECDTATDSALTAGSVPASRLNGLGGNGFDDDCDGLVDEGCSCPANGVTKDCYLVPATQVDGTSGKPVGWCAANAKGSVDCTGGELGSWSGVCRGAQPPRLVDSCSPGDFNCDGLESNNAVEGCNCPNSVTCPTNVITLAPYPNERAIPLIDGSLWIGDVNARGRTTNWTWTVLGGDCDNVLPFPTFALYNQADSTVTTARKGARTPVRLDTTQTPAKYVPASGAPLIAIRASGYGSGAAGGKVYPAFGLSGDYIVQGEFTLDGKTYSCTQKVQVRAPGIRAELCWDSVGGDGSNGNDVDLHFARLQGTDCMTKGWTSSCLNSNGSNQDCYYAGSVSGCTSSASNGPRWGYPDSADTACLGWSSKRDPLGTQGCTNPRLDRDNVTCIRSIDDPTDIDFCGPENINIDNPNNNDTFVVGVNHYQRVGTLNAKPHVNLYCNGERVVSVGYNPATGQTNFPKLVNTGAGTTGDFWTVATIKANVVGGSLTSCTVNTVPSRVADATRDGMPNPGGTGNDLCVDHANVNGAPGYTTKFFVETGMNANLLGNGAQGSQPTAAAGFCKH